MSAFNKTLTTLLPLMLIGGGVFATSALAQERCSGTFCDLFYSARGAPPATTQPTPQSTAPTPMTVPSTGGILNFFKSTPSGPTAQGGVSAPSNSFVKLDGGGLLGDKSQRCSGSICDLYYGGPPPAQPTVPAAAAARPAPGARPPTPGQVAPAREVETAEMASLRQADERRRVAQAAEQQAKAKCRVANDPWHCYR